MRIKENSPQPARKIRTKRRFCKSELRALPSGFSENSMHKLATKVAKSPQDGMKAGAVVFKAQKNRNLKQEPVQKILGVLTRTYLHPYMANFPMKESKRTISYLRLGVAENGSQ